MTKKFCDACGKQIDERKDPPEIRFKVQWLTHSWGDIWWQKLDICTECFKGLRELGWKLQDERVKKRETT